MPDVAGVPIDGGLPTPHPALPQTAVARLHGVCGLDVLARWRARRRPSRKARLRRSPWEWRHCPVTAPALVFGGVGDGRERVPSNVLGRVESFFRARVGDGGWVRPSGPGSCASGVAGGVLTVGSQLVQASQPMATPLAGGGLGACGAACRVARPVRTPAGRPPAPGAGTPFRLRCRADADVLESTDFLLRAKDPRRCSRRPSLSTRSCPCDCV